MIININLGNDGQQLRRSHHLARIEPKTRVTAIGRAKKGSERED